MDLLDDLFHAIEHKIPSDLLIALRSAIVKSYQTVRESDKDMKSDFKKLRDTFT